MNKGRPRNENSSPGLMYTSHTEWGGKASGKSRSGTSFCSSVIAFNLARRRTIYHLAMIFQRGPPIQFNTGQQAATSAGRILLLAFLEEKDVDELNVGMFFSPTRYFPLSICGVDFNRTLELLMDRTLPRNDTRKNLPEFSLSFRFNLDRQGEEL